MSKKNIFWIIAGLLNFAAALIHVFPKQQAYLDPLLDSSEFKNQIVVEIFGVWHLVTVLFLLTSSYLIYKGFSREGPQETEGAFLIGVLFCALILPFIAVFEMMYTFIPFPILFVLIACFIFLGIRKEKNDKEKLRKELIRAERYW